jgi:hypothetical protein
MVLLSYVVPGVGGLLLIEIIRFQTHLIAPGSTYLHFFIDRVILLLVGSYALLGISRGRLLGQSARLCWSVWLLIRWQFCQ